MISERSLKVGKIGSSVERKVASAKMIKKEKMRIICKHIEDAIRLDPEYSDIEVRYYRMTLDMLTNLGADVAFRFGLVDDDEYILFMRDNHILYARNVSGDSPLTAMAEACCLAAYKF